MGRGREAGMREDGRVKEEEYEEEGRVVKGSGWGKSGNEIRNVESRSLERAVRGSHGGSVQKPKVNTQEQRRGGERGNE
jgi:hypothetical protein